MTSQTNQVQGSTTISDQSSDHGLTGYLQLIYIRYGNNMFTQQSLQFNQLLTATNQSLDVLTSLMDLRNNAMQQTSVMPFSTFAKQPPYNWYADKEYSNDTSGDSKYLKDWKSAWDAYQGYLSTTPPVYFGYNNQAWSAGSPEFAQWVSAAAIYRTNLNTTIQQLSAQMTVDQRNDPASLYSKLKAVMSGMPPEPSKDFTAWSSWAMDGWQNGVTTAGSGPIKQALDNAQNAATNFLNQTTQNLQIFQNLMSEYYKSCSALLKASSDTISNMARKISN